MSHYVNEYVVLSAIKAILDADSTLDNLLFVRSGSSKVILGVERPIHAALPVVHLSFLIRDINPETKANNLLVRVTWYVASEHNEIERIEDMADIGECIYDLLDDTALSISDYRVDLFSAESGESSAKDIQEPEGRDNHFQSLTFRMAIRRTS